MGNSGSNSKHSCELVSLELSPLTRFHYPKYLTIIVIFEFISHLRVSFENIWYKDLLSHNIIFIDYCTEI